MNSPAGSLVPHDRLYPSYLPIVCTGVLVFILWIRVSTYVIPGMPCLFFHPICKFSVHVLIWIRVSMICLVYFSIPSVSLTFALLRQSPPFVIQIRGHIEGDPVPSHYTRIRSIPFFFIAGRLKRFLPSPTHVELCIVHAHTLGASCSQCFRQKQIRLGVDSDSWRLALLTCCSCGVQSLLVCYRGRRLAVDDDCS